MSDVQVTLDRHGAGTTITVDSADASGAFRNGLLTSVAVLGPDGARQDVPLTQVAPGRYVGELGELPPGAYLLGVTQQAEPGGPIVAGGTSGLVVDYSPEYGPPSGDGSATLERARDLTDGSALDPSRPAEAFTHDLPPATVQTPLWPWLTLAALLLLPFDIAVRRWAIGRRELAGIGAALRRAPRAATPEHPPTHATVLVRNQHRRTLLRRGIDQSPGDQAKSPPTATPPPNAAASEPTRASDGPDRAASPPSRTTSDLLAAKRRASRARSRVDDAENH
jgi:hypothetical protein